MLSSIVYLGPKAPCNVVASALSNGGESHAKQLHKILTSCVAYSFHPPPRLVHCPSLRSDFVMCTGGLDTEWNRDINTGELDGLEDGIPREGMASRAQKYRTQEPDDGL